MKNLISELASAIHIGGRDEQQDSVKIHTLNNAHLLVVADGMGGHRGGQLASSIAVDVMVSQFIKENGVPQNPQDFLKQTIHLANAEINRQGEQQNIKPRTTIVVAIIIENQAFWAHVGDSRLYLFKKGVFSERTRDHSVVQMLLDTDQITEEEMGTHPDQNRLLQSVGGENPPKVTIGQSSLESGDAIFLCSDGLWERFDIPEMTKAANLEGKADIKTWTQKMVEEAAKRGGPKGDNVSLAVYKHQTKKIVPSMPKSILAIISLSVILILGIASYGWIKHGTGIDNSDQSVSLEQPAIDSSISVDALETDKQEDRPTP
ncbi:PP2C family protein-serine/threonine phosphatase [Thiomicrospira microaerophila]|uniref:PP2C family protein-serine/threonine phosphatase n=1 Tax=Thiomicrospira microaerophila TaxID=406020 RepID=UPI000698961B|nr:protein phosphatase 2C domain-containing protein [Thiomicrospira microaerophila]